MYQSKNKKQKKEMEVVMKLSLFNNITKQLKAEIDEYWSSVTMEQIPEDELRHPNDPSYKISHDVKSAGMDWEMEINYNRYLQSSGVYENETVFGQEPMHSHRAAIETKVNGAVVARYRQDIDLLEPSGRVSKELGYTIYKLVTKP